VIPCPGVKSDGSACRSDARCPTGSGFCPSHCACADCAAQRAANAAKGARNRRSSTKVIPLAAQPFGGKPQDLEQATEYGAWLVGAIASGELDPRVGRETAAALNVLKGVLAAKDLTAHKVHQLKERLLKEINAQNRDR
jgi:hypothetical protein